MRFVVAIVASLLPRYYWRQLETTLPVSRAALLSGVVSMLAAAAIAIPAFLRYTEATSLIAIDAMLRATGWRTTPAGDAAPSADAAVASWFSGYLSPMAFFLFTPIGLLSIYLFVTGWLRAVSAYVDDARGDPVLSTIDAVVRRARERSRSQREREERERLEGPEVADRVVTGTAAGLPEADLVVVASRRKPEWETGVFVITAEKWFKLGTPVDRQMPGGLRTLYPLTEITANEVLRRGIQYDLPPVSGKAPRSS